MFEIHVRAIYDTALRLIAEIAGERSAERSLSCILRTEKCTTMDARED